MDIYNHLVYLFKNEKYVDFFNLVKNVDINDWDLKNSKTLHLLYTFMFYKIKLLEFDFYPLFSKFKEYSEKTRNITKLLIYHYHNNNTYNNIHHPMPFEKKNGD